MGSRIRAPDGLARQAGTWDRGSDTALFSKLWGGRGVLSSPTVFLCAVCGHPAAASCVCGVRRRALAPAGVRATCITNDTFCLSGKWGV
jgi:hypothetical protein